jgi:hypothetical protein
MIGYAFLQSRTQHLVGGIQAIDGRTSCSAAASSRPEDYAASASRQASVTCVNASRVGSDANL